MKYPGSAIKHPGSATLDRYTTCCLCDTGNNAPLFQGLQGVNLTQDQLVIIQQKVKTELLKQQAMARQQNRPPPTKVVKLSLLLMMSLEGAAQALGHSHIIQEKEQMLVPGLSVGRHSERDFVTSFFHFIRYIIQFSVHIFMYKVCPQSYIISSSTYLYLLFDSSWAGWSS
jgi:hypothetical protein